MWNQPHQWPYLELPAGQLSRGIQGGLANPQPPRPSQVTAQRNGTRTLNALSLEISQAQPQWWDLRWTKKSQSPIASVQRTQSTLAGDSAVPRGTNAARMNANCAIRIAAQRTQGLWGPISVFWGEHERQRTLPIRIAAVTLTSDFAITVARFRPSKERTVLSCGPLDPYPESPMETSMMNLFMARFRFWSGTLYASARLWSFHSFGEGSVPFLLDLQGDCQLKNPSIRHDSCLETSVEGDEETSMERHDWEQQETMAASQRSEQSHKEFEAAA